MQEKQGLLMPNPSTATQSLTIARPDDWHLHLRDGPAMAAVLAATAGVYGRAIVMPNLRPPVATTESARAYRQRILDALPADSRFTPLMTLYLTDNTSAAEIAKAKASGFVHAVKYYPAGATTHSDAGVTGLERVYPALAAMQEAGVVLSIHGEVTDAEVDIFDRERIFVERLLSAIVRDFPALKIVLEHITTAEAAAFVAAAPPNIAATITPQHLLYSRNALFAGGVRPHLYCLPVLKRERHREALLAAATGGNPKFFLGTDSAPHAVHAKENACGCAGCFSAPVSLGLYAEAFESVRALDRFEGFASHFGADFYGLPRHGDKVTLKRESWVVPAEYPFGEHRVVPLRAGEKVAWRVVS
jgi:dihydroorotase